MEGVWEQGAGEREEVLQTGRDCITRNSMHVLLGGSNQEG